MLFPPISKEFNNLFLNQEELEKTNLYSEKSNILQNILLSNNNPNKLEESILFFIKSAYNTSNLIETNKSTVVKMVFLRTLFETAVLFRLLTLSITRNNNKDLFVELLTRFKDQGEIEEYNTLEYNLSLEIKEKIKTYEKEKHKRLELEYDWLLPLFYTEKTKKKIDKLTFRELVYRTKEVDNLLVEELKLYKLSSQIIHCNYLQNYYSSLKTETEIVYSYKRICNCILIDYLNLINILYYKNNLNNSKIKQLNIYCNKLIRILILER